MSIIIQYLEKLLLNWSIDDPSNCQTRPPFKVLHPVMKQRLGEGTLLYIGLHTYTCSSFCMNLTYMQLLASCKQRLVALIVNYILCCIEKPSCERSVVCSVKRRHLATVRTVWHSPCLIHPVEHKV